METKTAFGGLGFVYTIHLDICKHDERFAHIKCKIHAKAEKIEQKEIRKDTERRKPIFVFYQLYLKR